SRFGAEPAGTVRRAPRVGSASPTPRAPDSSRPFGAEPVPTPSSPNADADADEDVAARGPHRALEGQELRHQRAGAKLAPAAPTPNTVVVRLSVGVEMDDGSVGTECEPCRAASGWGAVRHADAPEVGAPASSDAPLGEEDRHRFVVRVI